MYWGPAGPAWGPGPCGFGGCGGCGGAFGPGGCGGGGACGQGGGRKKRELVPPMAVRMQQQDQTIFGAHPAMGSMQPSAKRAKVDQVAAPGAAGAQCVGEVRFENAQSAHQALALHGSVIAGNKVIVELDDKSKDQTKILVRGLPASMTYQVLKAHFAFCGDVCFACIKAGGSSLPCVGSVRFATQEEAEEALDLSGSELNGYTIEVKPHPGSKDSTKLQIYNLPPGTEWQKLKDLFVENGATPEFVEVIKEAAARTGEVRYANATDAKSALQQLNGSSLAGVQISVAIDPKSQDGCKLLVAGVPAGVEWQEVKDHFSQVGPVAFAKMGDPKGKGMGAAAAAAGAAAVKAGMYGGMMGCMGGGMGGGMGGCMGGGMMGGGMGGGMGGCMGGGMMGGGMMGGGRCGGMGGGMGSRMSGGMGGGMGMPPGKPMGNGMVMLPNGLIVSANSQGAPMPGQMLNAYGAPMMNTNGCGGGGCTGGSQGRQGSQIGVGEVRFKSQEDAQSAPELLSGTTLNGATIQVILDQSSQDLTKIMVKGLAPGTKWQDLKEHCQAEAGEVAFAHVK